MMGDLLPSARDGQKVSHLKTYLVVCTQSSLSSTTCFSNVLKLLLINKFMDKLLEKYPKLGPLFRQRPHLLERIKILSNGNFIRKDMDPSDAQQFRKAVTPPPSGKPSGRPTIHPVLMTAIRQDNPLFAIPTAHNPLINSFLDPSLSIAERHEKRRAIDQLIKNAKKKAQQGYIGSMNQIISEIQQIDPEYDARQIVNQLRPVTQETMKKLVKRAQQCAQQGNSDQMWKLLSKIWEYNPNFNADPIYQKQKSTQQLTKQQEQQARKIRQAKLYAREGNPRSVHVLIQQLRAKDPSFDPTEILVQLTPHRIQARVRQHADSARRYATQGDRQAMQAEIQTILKTYDDTFDATPIRAQLITTTQRKQKLVQNAKKLARQGDRSEVDYIIWSLRKEFGHDFDVTQIQTQYEKFKKSLDF